MFRLCLVSLLSLLGIVYTHDTGLTPQHISQDPPGDLNLTVMNPTSTESSREGPLMFELPSNYNADVATEPVHDRNTAYRSPASNTPNKAALQTEVTPKEPASIYTKDENILKAQIEEFKRNYNEGRRVMVILRGAPGSGKSYLARKLVDATVGQASIYENHIFGVDDFFMINGVHVFNRSMLYQAFGWNNDRVFSAAQKGLSPIIVESVIVRCCLLEPYLRAGVENGYIVKIMEPRTPWAKNATELHRRNLHGVTEQDIKMHLNNFQDCNEVIKKYKILV